MAWLGIDIISLQLDMQGQPSELVLHAVVVFKMNFARPPTQRMVFLQKLNSPECFPPLHSTIS